MKKTSIFGKKWKKAAAPGLQSQSRHCCVSQDFPQSSVPSFDLKRDHLTYMWTSLVECLFLCFWKSTNKQEKPQQFLYYCNKIYYSLLRSDGLVYMWQCAQSIPINTYFKEIHIGTYLPNLTSFIALMQSAASVTYWVSYSWAQTQVP